MKTRERYVLVLDAGTTGVKAYVYGYSSERIRMLSESYKKTPVRSPKSGWIEQDAEVILKACIQVMRNAVRSSGIPPTSIESAGLTNQRETTILWDAETERPIAPAVVWEDRRTERRASILKKTHDRFVRERTGLSIGSYFSATKIAWLLEHVRGAKLLTDVGRLRFGTPDTWLIANLCADRPHVTDFTNASRTLLFDINKKAWDPELCEVFSVPERILPKVLPSRAEFGTLKESIVGAPIPLRAVIGDQQSSMYAAIANSPGVRRPTKVTYGTGTFLMQVVGSRFAVHDPFFTTLVPVPGTPKPAYALEAKIGVSGPVVTKLLRRPAALRAYFERLTREVTSAVRKLPVKPRELVIDGGITRSALLAPIQAEASGMPIRELPMYNGTALGVAIMLTQ